MTEEYGLASFRSRQQVLRLEAQLRRQGVSARVVSTPREVASGCGLSVKFQLNDARAVAGEIKRGGYSNMIGVYRAESANGSKARLSPLPL